MKRKRESEPPAYYISQQPDPTDAAQQGDADFGGTDFHISVPGVTIINGPPREGKSHLISYIMGRKAHKFSHGVLFSNTAMDPKNLPFVDPAYRHLTYSPDVLEALEKYQYSFPREERPLAFCIFDDCVADPKQWSCPVLLRCVTTTYHNNIYFCLSTQYINKVASALREAYFQAILFRTQTKRSLTAAYESYGQDFDSLNAFREMMVRRLGDKRFAYKNKFAPRAIANDSALPDAWLIARAPPDLPEFRIETRQLPRPHAKPTHHPEQHRPPPGAAVEH